MYLFFIETFVFFIFFFHSVLIGLLSLNEAPLRIYNEVTALENEGLPEQKRNDLATWLIKEEYCSYAFNAKLINTHKIYAYVVFVYSDLDCKI